MAKEEFKTIKVEGENFEKIKAAKTAMEEAREKAEVMLKEAHDNFWGAISSAYPETKDRNDLHLDSQFEDTGTYFITPGCDCGDVHVLGGELHGGGGLPDALIGTLIANKIKELRNRGRKDEGKEAKSEDKTKH